MGERRLINGRKITQLRALLGLEQQDLAREAGISKQHMSDIERGKSDASARVAEALANALAAAILRAITTHSDERPT